MSDNLKEGWRQAVFWRRRHVLAFTGWSRITYERMLERRVILPLYLDGEAEAHFSSAAVREACGDLVAAARWPGRKRRRWVGKS